MPGGRPRKPSAIRHLEGNRSNTPIPDELPLEGIPETPEWINGAAAEHFAFVVSQMAAVGAVKKLDEPALTMLSTLYALYQNAVENVDVDAACKLSARWNALARNRPRLQSLESLAST